MRKLGNTTIEKVEEICGSGFKPTRMFPKFNQQAFDTQKGWMQPDYSTRRRKTSRTTL